MPHSPRGERLAARTLGIMLAGSLAGCQTSPSPDLPRGAGAYEVIPPPSDGARPEYLIGSLDVLNVRVFQEPELSFEELQVDAAGNVVFPLIGKVRAGGRTASDFANEIAARLGQRYLVNPRVSVFIVSSVSQTVTVEGNVTEPGVYEIRGSATLLTALARAKSTTRVARLDEVVIFRTINGQRTGAVFNLADIRAGRAPDPELRGGDVVVVGFSFVKGAFRDFLTTAPFFSVFRNF